MYIFCFLNILYIQIKYYLCQFYNIILYKNKNKNIYYKNKNIYYKYE